MHAAALPSAGTAWNPTLSLGPGRESAGLQFAPEGLSAGDTDRRWGVTRGPFSWLEGFLEEGPLELSLQSSYCSCDCVGLSELRTGKMPGQPRGHLTAASPAHTADPAPLTFSSGVGENIFSSWGCLEKSKG